MKDTARLKKSDALEVQEIQNDKELPEPLRLMTGEMVVAYIDSEREKWIVGEVVSCASENRAKHQIRQYGPWQDNYNQLAVARWKWASLYVNEKTGAQRAKKGAARTRHDQEVLLDVKTDQVIYAFRELDREFQLPEEALAVLSKVLPNNIQMKDAFNWI